MYKQRVTPHVAIIGRFQPFHNAHKALLDACLTSAQHVVVVLGSALKRPTPKNPLSPELREQAIRVCFDDAQNDKLTFVAQRDWPYAENLWLSEVRQKVLSAFERHGGLSDDALDAFGDTQVTIAGHYKDESSYYLNSFPTWQQWSLPGSHDGLSATDLREAWFAAGDVAAIAESVPAASLPVLRAFQDTDAFAALLAEHGYNQDYKRRTQYVDAPFTPVFVTVDAVVEQSGHVLVVERKVHPGKGTLALPGGFVQPGEPMQAAMLRELKEETRLSVPRQTLKAHIRADRVFDHPGRSERGRVITRAFHVHLPDDRKRGLPKVKGGDDAADAFWMPIGDIARHEERFFEDHAHIIRAFTAV